jgi:hypothetical protein
MPPGPSHVGTVFSITFSSNLEMVAFAAIVASLPIDFFVRSTGKVDARHDLLVQLPLLDKRLRAPAVNRALRLNCLTTAYAGLWGGSCLERHQERYLFQR